MDHGFNASTFTARVIASTGADLAACLVGAIGSFSGPLHGGAPSRALEALDEIGTLDRADGWVRERISSGDRIMGFGHAVYRTRDPRSEMLKAIARGWDDPLVDLAVGVEDAIETVLAELKPGRELHANVEFYAGVVMKLAGLDPSMFTPTFCVARVGRLDREHPRAEPRSQDHPTRRALRRSAAAPARADGLRAPPFRPERPRLGRRSHREGIEQAPTHPFVGACSARPGEHPVARRRPEPSGTPRSP